MARAAEVRREVATSRWENPTGGFGYHLRALVRRRGLWAPFVRDLARWLHAWSPPERSLLLIGPSGGHCLDLDFLARFSQLTAVDIDPFAPWLFRWRTRTVLRRGTRLTWDARDHLSPDAQGFTLEPFRALLAAHPDTAVLFCNILGQLPLLGDDRAPDHDDDAPPVGSYEHWLRALPDALFGRAWAPLHDRLSGPVRPHAVDPENPVAWSSAEDLVRQHYPPTDDPTLALFDHRTSALLPDVPRSQFVWELEPGTFHLIEALHSP
jgi:hypothetical protein